MPTEKQTQHTLVIRLWREEGNGKPVWRGSVTDIQTGETKYFQSLPDLAEVIARVVGTASMEEGGAPQKAEDDRLSNS
ncbi:MAG: hypothetical protein HYU84_18535 [Chloroflexi bacterium]|nr:hypothetical protein [Chloroflexota bacterium]MBI3168081.1 hypothetical protein [Chloroflexota bacterium]